MVDRKAVTLRLPVVLLAALRSQYQEEVPAGVMTFNAWMTERIANDIARSIKRQKTK